MLAARVHVPSLSVLTRGRLRSRAAKFQRLVDFLPTTCDESEKRAKRGHNCNSLGVHDSTPILSVLHSNCMINAATLKSFLDANIQTSANLSTTAPG
jgi:hypothetical protein